MNFLHHRERIIDLLGCAPTRTAIRNALMQWAAIAFETAAYEYGGVVAAMRSPEEWMMHAQAAAIAAMPAVRIEKIDDAPARPLPAGSRPLSGLRILGHL